MRQSMCLQRMEEKFINQQYDSITEFVADFRLMLENCYRFHGVDHWISKQAQKLEIMLEQKLTLLSRTLREKTTLAVTSKGRFGAEEERGSGGTSTRRRLAPRSLATITVGGHESMMVQTLRLEEQQRAKDEKRQRELEKKEAEEMSAKEVEEWEQTLLSHASPHTVATLWELPAIGHFLCLAQTALNLPEIIFFELERCLLMPRCSTLLSKIMSSLLSPPQRRATLHRRPALTYCRWESDLRQRVMVWYRAVGASRDQPGRAEQLGLCHQFFSILGDISPLEEKPFHLLPFYQRVWLLKGLCDHVYETQKDVQDALLSQPIHECRESILGYDSKENAYIHFPHFCGADLRIYCQSPSAPPAFPFPSVWVKRVEIQQRTEVDHFDGIKGDSSKSDKRCYGGSLDTAKADDFKKGGMGTLGLFKRDNWQAEDDKKILKRWSLKEESEMESSAGDSCDDLKSDSKISTNSSSSHRHNPFRGICVEMHLKEEPIELKHQSKQLILKQKQDYSMGLTRTIKPETQEPCLSVGEHSYTGRSPARLVRQASPIKSVDLKMETECLSQECQRSSCLEGKTCCIKSEERQCCCSVSGPVIPLLSESAQNSSEDRMNDNIWTKKKRRKKKQGGEQLPRVKGEHKQQQHADRTRLCSSEAIKSAVQRVAKVIKRKDRKKKHKTGKKLETSKNCEDEPPLEPSFMLVCTSLEELRQLISKTEDELDDLESTKKRLGRWYYRREAVKDLHSTLIRLLNELLPWEPKLVKAFQRNRLRLKKEFDDFKKHPEYNNFVREECISSSSSSDDNDDEEEIGLGKEMCSLSDHYRRSQEEDLEHIVPRCLWSGASTGAFVSEPAGERTSTYIPPNHLKHPLTGIEKGCSLVARGHVGISDINSTVDSGPQSRTELIPSNQSMESDSAGSSSVPSQASVSPKLLILHPTAGLPKGYTPIPTLLAKSVGNKVTLMKRPVDYPGVSNIDRRNKGSLISLSTSPVLTTKLPDVHSSLSNSQQNLRQIQTQGLKQTKVPRQPEIVTLTAALPKSQHAKQTQTAPINPAQMVCKVPERLGQLVRTDRAGSLDISVHPLVDQQVQQVVILPSNLLIHKTEEEASSTHQQQCKDIQVQDRKVASPLCMSTNVPGFTIPENSIPFQQVTPLNDSRTLTSPSVSPHLQEGSMNKAGFKGTHVSSPQASTAQSAMPNLSSLTASCAISTEPVKSTGLKQELKTVCIRDSQSILVTTRGGNTGIVKVQTSSEQNALGSLPTNPIITISPQFKAFLISKTSQTLPQYTSSQTSPTTIPAVTTSISVAQPQNQVSSVLKPPSAIKYPMITAGTCVTSVNQAASTTVALGQGFNNSVGSTVATTIGKQAQTAVVGSHFQSSLLKNTVVPSLISSIVPQVLSQAEFINKTVLKRPSTDESSQPTKFILVTPSSASNTALSKGTCSAKSLPTSRVMFISQPTVTTTTTSLGSIPQHAVATGTNVQLMPSSLSSQTVKMELSPSHSVGMPNSETLSKGKNITVPSDIKMQLSGTTANIGQSIGVRSCLPSKSTPMSILDTDRPTATTGLVLVTNSNETITNCSDQLASHTSLTTTSRLHCIPSFIKLSQADPSSSSSPSTSLIAPEMFKNDLGTPPNILSNMSPAQMTTTTQKSPAQATHAHQSSNIQSDIGEGTTLFSSSSHLAVSKTQALIATSRTTNTQANTGTIQQRIVISTSTPLAAGTQILLNNTRFVVPLQGLGPGSHVLIISSPPTQQVPTAIASQMANHVTLTPGASVLSQTPARLPCVPAASCPFVACAPAVVPSLLPSNPKATPIRSTTAPCLGSTVLHCKTNVVSSLPKFPATHTGNFASLPVSSPTLLSSPPRFGNAPGLLSNVTAVSSSLATVRCSSTISPAVACPLARLSASQSSLNCSLPAKQIVSVTSPSLVLPIQQTTLGIHASSTALSKPAVHTGQDDIATKRTELAGMQPVLTGMRTHVLPTASVQSIANTVSRMQTVPIATVTPIGRIVDICEAAPVVTPHSSSSSALNTPAQTMASLRTNNSIHPPVVLTTQALGKYSLQASSLGMPTNVAPKLLISPDGAVLSTVQCQVKPTELTASPKPMDALLVSHNRTSGGLHTQDSS
ncbi:uncharacterized bromodomain-containing protein 10 isoform X2 [Antennarius striatus]